MKFPASNNRTAQWWLLTNLTAFLLVVVYLRAHLVLRIDSLLDLTGQLTLFQWIGLLAPGLTAIFIFVCHRQDCAKDGPGLQARFRRIRGPKYTTEISFVSAAITKQSVLVAIAIGAILMVASREPGAPFGRIVSGLAIFGLACSVVCTLVSILCYDYAVRFNWTIHYREDLLRKALLIEVWGWYLLTLSFILAIELVSISLGLTINLIYGLLLLFYYFPGRYYLAKERFWCGTDEYLKKKKLPMVVTSVRRAGHPSRDHGSVPWKGYEWEISASYFPPEEGKELERVSVKEDIADEDLQCELAKRW